MTKPIVLDFEGKVSSGGNEYRVHIPKALSFKARDLYRRWVQVKIQGEDTTLEFQARISKTAQHYAVRIPKAILFKAVTLHRKPCIIRIEELYPEER